MSKPCHSAREPHSRLFADPAAFAPAEHGAAMLAPEQEELRLQALDAYHILDTEAERDFDGITELAARVCNAPTAVISLVGRDRHWFKARFGTDIQELPRAQSITSLTMHDGDLTVIPDTLLEARLQGHESLRLSNPVRFYASAPLVTPDGHVLGALVVTSRQPGMLNAEQRLTLKSLAQQVIIQLELRKKNRALHAERSMKDLILDTSPVGIFIFAEDGAVVEVNAAAALLTGGTREQLLAQNFHAVQALKASGLYDCGMRALQTNAPTTAVLHHHSTFGKDAWLMVNFSVLSSDTGRRLLMLASDISELKRADRAARDSLQLLDSLTQRVPGVLYQFRMFPDGRATVPFANKGLAEIYEMDPAEVQDDAWPALNRTHPDDMDAFLASIKQSAETLQPWSMEFRVMLPRQGLRWRQGSAMPERLDDGSVLWHGYISDITDRKAAEERTTQLAYFDPLTGLPNRAQLLDRIESAVTAAARNGRYGALLFLDLDNFKRINDARGHSVGDLVLRRVGERISGVLRTCDLVARLGGDEFVVLLTDLAPDHETAGQAATAIAERVREVLDQPCEIDGGIYSLSGSIGFTLFPKADEKIEDLLREADTAMYRAKESGRNQIACFVVDMQAEVEERLAIEQDLKTAVGNGQVRAYVQSQVDAAGRVTGGEILLRWNHPVRGFIPPARFIPIAEESGIIHELGAWVLRQACEALARLQEAGSGLCLSVNISPRQFRQDAFVERVCEILSETGAPADRLVFEVTEGLLIENWKAAASRMAELNALGVRFSIDDFGTGYSSLAYLRRLPLHELKIDRSFVQETPHDADDMAIVQSILSVARHLKLRVVAEGVENAAQANCLLASGCDCLQGYFFARPEPMGDWISAWIGPFAEPLHARLAPAA